jgi:fibronectin type 3 domain-containing protein
MGLATRLRRRVLNRSWLVAAGVAALLGLGLLVAMPTTAGADPPTPADQLNAAFGSYGDTGGRWAGGDGSVSVRLPDGRVAWFFSDTFVGSVNADGSLPAGTSFVRNSAVLQSGTQLVSTLTGGAAPSLTSLVDTGVANEVYWVGSAAVEGNTVKVLYTRIRTGTGALDLTPIGNALATFSLPDLSLQSVTALSTPASVAWGSSMVSDAGYTYIYGTEAVSGTTKFAHVARVPVGGLAGAWQFWDGATWSADPASSARLMSGVGENFGTQVVNGQFVLVTMESSIAFDDHVVAYTSASATGPFTGPIELFQAPRPTVSDPTAAIIAYNVQLHPEQAAPGTLLLSYDVNDLDQAGVAANVSIYRPRFTQIGWPRPQPDPATLPAAPTQLTGATDLTGVEHLQWQAPAGLSFSVYQRDVTAGQTQGALAATATQNSADVGRLTSGHTYEFRLSATNTAGEGPQSTVVSQAITIAPPAAPDGVTATASAPGAITVSWNPVPAAASYIVYRRDVTDGDTDFVIDSPLLNTNTFTVADNLINQHVYEFEVIATHEGGESPRSAAASATAFFPAPGAPTGLTATANPADGTIALSWTAPAQTDVWYLVYQRDVTTAETDFSQLPLPITSGTTVSAGMLTNGDTYEFKVSATNRGGEGPASAVASATSSWPPPGAPGTLSAVPTDGGAVLTWSAGSTPDAWYYIYVRDVTAGETTFTQLPLPISTCCTFTASMMTNGDTYEFKVAATAQGGISTAASNTVQVTPMPPLAGAATGLTATPNPDGSIHLAWTSAAGGPYWSYVYVRDVTNNETTFTKLSWPVSTCCTFDVGAGYNAQNHVYEYKLTQLNSMGQEGPFSTTAQATAHYNPPPAPTNLRGYSTGDGNITLDWDAPPNYYWVYYRDVTAGQTTFSKSVYPTNALTAVWGNLVNAHVYEFKISATGLGGEGPASTPVQITSYGGLPQPATNLHATAGDGKATLTWTASTTRGAVYVIFGRDTTIGESFKQLPGTASCCTFTANTLTVGHTYEYRITASNASGQSAATSPVQVTPMPPIPAAPTNLHVTPGDTTATLTWTASTTANVSYWVEFNRTGTWVRVPSVGGCCTYVVYNLVNQSSYQFRVFATNLSGDSTSASNVVSGTPVPPTPAQPTNMRVVTSGDGFVTVAWNASPTPNVLYSIEVANSSSGPFAALKYPVVCCQLKVMGQMNGTRHWFRVRAVNAYASSTPTATVSAVPMPPLPDAPNIWSTNAAGPNHNGEVSINWKPIATRYITFVTYWRLAGTQTWHMAAQNLVQYGWAFYFTSYRGELYEFKVAARNMSGETDSNIVTLWSSDTGPGVRINPLNESKHVNALALFYAGLQGADCESDRGFQNICYGVLLHDQHRPYTVGDYMMFPGNGDRLSDWLMCQAFLRANMRYNHLSESMVDAYGPDLFRHEENHSGQWAMMGLDFEVIYWSYPDPWEDAANAYWGEYRTYPSGPAYYTTTACSTRSS